MRVAFLTLAAVYLVFLALSAILGRKLSRHGPLDFIAATGRIALPLVFLSFAATLFSTFTIIGLPDFFRNHGVAAWIFLGVTDVALACVLLWFGLRLRLRMPKLTKSGAMSVMLERSYGRAAPWVYIVTVSIFLLPYLVIQIRGTALLLQGVFSTGIPLWLWILGMTACILIYSAIGGVRAIVYSDAFQGVLLLAASWLIAISCLRQMRGFRGLLEAVESANESLLSSPGPAGLLSPAFLFASFLVIVLMPITQPQLSSRIVMAKSEADLRIMALAVGIFSILAVAPAMVIGLFGAVRYEAMPMQEFVSRVLVIDQTPWLGAAALIGLIAAAMSTADSQLFSLSSEVTLARRRQHRLVNSVKLYMAVLALAAAILALVASDQIVLLARVSFAGTALLAPMLIIPLFIKPRGPALMPMLTSVAVLVFALSCLDFIPSLYFDFRIEVILLAGLSLAALVEARRSFKAEGRYPPDVTLNTAGAPE